MVKILLSILGIIGFFATCAHADLRWFSPYGLLSTTNTWMAAQIGIGSYPNWLIDGSFIGPNAPGVNTIKFKSLLINGDMNILNAFGTIDQ
jgi:hypothetical protein